MNKENIQIANLRNLLMDIIQSEISTAQVNGSLSHRISGNLNMVFPGANNEAIIAALPETAISSGAACTTSTMAPSHVLLALGLS